MKYWPFIILTVIVIAIVIVLVIVKPWDKSKISASSSSGHVSSGQAGGVGAAVFNTTGPEICGIEGVCGGPAPNEPGGGGGSGPLPPMSGGPPPSMSGGPPPSMSGGPPPRSKPIVQKFTDMACRELSCRNRKPFRRAVTEYFGIDCTSEVDGCEDCTCATLTNEVSAIEDSNWITVTSNGVPNYIPRFKGYDISGSWADVLMSFDNWTDRNPNGIAAQQYSFRIPKNPVSAMDAEGNEYWCGCSAWVDNAVVKSNASITWPAPTSCEILSAAGTEAKGNNWTPMGPIGVAVNGVPFYNAWADPEYNLAMDSEAFDICCGHPNGFSAYHYHKYPLCIRGAEGLSQASSQATAAASLNEAIAAGTHSSIMGYSFDGYPVYGATGPNGKLMKSGYEGTEYTGNGDLDICNGIDGPTPEYPDGIYHYHMTLEQNEDGTVATQPEDGPLWSKGDIIPAFPYIIARYHGVPSTTVTSPTVQTTVMQIAGYFV